ncbi:MAG: hypothetical protein V7784_20435 [Oceanospirillaceae bacterium]
MTQHCLLRKRVVFMSLLALLQACSANQRYSASGPVTMPDQSQSLAIIYWDKLVGRTWYGAKLNTSQSDVRLRVCNKGGIVKRFDENNASHTLQLKKRVGDTKILRVNDLGHLVDNTAAVSATSIANQNNCAKILVANKNAKQHELVVNSTPSLAVTCQSVKPNRYPKPGLYPLGQISKSNVDPDVKTNLCPE